MDETASATERRFGAAFQALPIWFWVAVLVGLVVRLWLVCFTHGTYDVDIWLDHTTGIQEYGLIGYYHHNPLMNHPPFISVFVYALAWLAKATSIPFATLLRLPMIFADAATLALLLQLLPQNRYRLPSATLYWLNPLAIIFSAFHGNTDSLLASVLVLSVFLLVRGSVVWTAVAIGASLWIKLPGILLVPALAFYFPHWWQRVRFLAIAAVVGVSTYLPALIADHAIVWDNVFAYKGQLVRTTAHQFVWGMRIFLMQIFDQLTPAHQETMLPYIRFYLKRDTWICLALVFTLIWLRRSRRTTRDIAITIVGSYAILYGFSNHWSFQYLAWSIPFWCLADFWFAAAATIFAGAYIWPLYAYLCGHVWLTGNWDFVGHPFWPKWLQLLRNLALLFFISASCGILAWSATSQGYAFWKRRRSLSTGRTPEPAIRTSPVAPSTRRASKGKKPRKRR
jgi:Gpi18-like mannosyltransferase